MWILATKKGIFKKDSKEREIKKLSYALIKPFFFISLTKKVHGRLIDWQKNWTFLFKAATDFQLSIKCGGQYSIKLQRINEILCCVHVMLLLFSLPPPFHFTLYYYVGHFLPPLSRNWAHPQVAFFASILKPYSQYHQRNLIVDCKLKNAFHSILSLSF